MPEDNMAIVNALCLEYFLTVSRLRGSCLCPLKWSL
uniref:Uncharacterized protein n=1 Tax=Arundo donax TaxID=35708 RepID=A0A0A8YJ51_ARUDO